MSWSNENVTTRAETARVAAGLRALGVERGDRVAGYLPNIPEAAIAFLACASIGATWSSCSPDFGARSVIDRLAQIEPKVLFTVDGYRYGGRDFDRLDVIGEIQRALTSLERTVVLPYLDSSPDLGRLTGAIACVAPRQSLRHRWLYVPQSNPARPSKTPPPVQQLPYPAAPPQRVAGRSANAASSQVFVPGS